MKEETFDSILQDRKQSIYNKLHKAKLEIGKVTKGNNNPFFKSKYADLNSLIEAVEPTLLKYDLILLQPIIDGKVHTQIIDIESGDMVESYLTLPTITDPQKIIASITYFRRGTLQSLLSLQAVDDDGNESKRSVQLPKSKPTISNERFEKGVEKVANDKLTKEAFLKMLEGFELSEVQKSALNLL